MEAVPCTAPSQICHRMVPNVESGVRLPASTCQNACEISPRVKHAEDSGIKSAACPCCKPIRHDSYTLRPVESVQTASEYPLRRDPARRHDGRASAAAARNPLIRFMRWQTNHSAATRRHGSLSSERQRRAAVFRRVWHCRRMPSIAPDRQWAAAVLGVVLTALLIAWFCKRRPKTVETSYLHYIQLLSKSKPQS